MRAAEVSIARVLSGLAVLPGLIIKCPYLWVSHIGFGPSAQSELPKTTGHGNQAGLPYQRLT